MTIPKLQRKPIKSIPSTGGGKQRLTLLMNVNTGYWTKAWVPVHILDNSIRNL